MSLKKTILIFGANGMLGRYLVSYFKNLDQYIVIEITRKEIDVCNLTYQKLNLLLNNYNNAYAINCIGKIPQRGDDDLKKYIQINAIFPHMLSACCWENGIKLIHITTDCVYNGLKGNYHENDLPDETNIYGMTKSLGEPSNCCIIRISIIGEELENKKSLLEWIKSNDNKTINGYTNHFWNGVTCLQLAKIINEMVEKNIFWEGVRHIFSPDKVSKYQLVRMIVDVFGLNIIVEPKETARVDKTLDTIYDKQFNIPTIREQLVKLKGFKLEYFKNN